MIPMLKNIGNIKDWNNDLSIWCCTQFKQQFNQHEITNDIEHRTRAIAPVNSNHHRPSREQYEKLYGRR